MPVVAMVVDWDLCRPNPSTEARPEDEPEVDSAVAGKRRWNTRT